MEEYTPEEFINLYRKFPNVCSWSHVASVTKQGNNVTTIFHNGYIIRFPILLHEGTWVVHGTVQYLHAKKYFHFGKLHRQGAPAWTRIVNNVTRFKAYCWNNKYHRGEDKPALCSRYVNGILHYQSWYKHGRKHRLGGPSYQEFDITGRLILEEWRIDNYLHRLDGSAKTVWNPENNSYEEKWYNHGVEGPAPIIEEVHEDVLEAPGRWYEPE